MKIQKLAAAACSCGRKHQIPIREIEIAPNLLSHLYQKLAGLGSWDKLLLVADENTWSAAGAQVEEALACRYALEKVILSAGFKPDEESVDAILSSSAHRPDLLLAVGSGTITDLVRYAAANILKIPFVSIPTAPSMDGYASTVSAMTFNGFKITKPARPPLAIYGDLAVLAKAPQRLISAGAADLLGKYTALSDWILARELEGEYYCPYIAGLVQDAADSCRIDTAAIEEGREDAIAKLTEGLILSGIGILMAGSSRPASGSEHHLAHFWEMKEQLEGGKEHLHGEKVAVGSVLSAKAYQFFLEQALDLASIRSSWRTGGLSWEEYKEKLTEVYGPLAGELPVMQAGPATYEPPRFSGRLASARSKIKPPSVRAIQERLRSTGAPASYQELGLPKKWVEDAILYGWEVRERYTIFTLLAQLGLLPKVLDAILA
ncbi:MAG: sn-glycerol-1-phosphate dehydrogenase [Firmicutes bacterium]|jgi:glycerol-1-phosphate dehydrogenase [NAD(P)+]|nr:sn-glycerol-1-phosphate dehydrogenase [Bacillota bacterium]HQD39650.1 sn-glycerol-1-phosphate dehydrogenase [Bacillota bacterium]